MTLATYSPQSHQTLASQIRFDEVLSTFKYFSKTIKILSLDCFDTILWRTAATPKDVFFDLAQQEGFKNAGITAPKRVHTEAYAYQLSNVQRGVRQASLKDIYRAHFPDLSEENLLKLEQEELASEIQACYAHPLAIELIRQASRLGIKIIVVSDTYFRRDQLLTLLSHHLPDELFKKISRVYCSCEMGKGKSEGLFQLLLDKFSVQPNKILHIGDNLTADFYAPRALGINAVHLNHFSHNLNEIFRMYAIASSMIDATVRTSRSLKDVYRGLYAQLNRDQAETTIGYVSLGPILYAFAHFIIAELQRLERQKHKKIKPLFLMRDAYLPACISEILAGKQLGHQVRISRFTAYASSFREKADIDAYLAERIQSHRFEDMCTQLLLPPELKSQILAKLEHQERPEKIFLKEIYHEDTQKIIFTESKKYFNRFIEYLKKEIQLEPDDTLLFIDLGYTGTAQNKLEPIFRKELNIEVTGCYLISLGDARAVASRHGLLDLSHYDDHALTCLVTFIAIIEQMCTTQESSVVNFDEQGMPIYSQTAINSAQNAKIKQIQHECMEFTKDALSYFNCASIHIDPQAMRDAAANHLARLIFFPTKSELDYMQDFEFDFNLGTNEILPIFDVNQGLSTLRRRTWLYSAKEGLKTMRMNYPAEWRAAGIELVLTLMAQHRFGFEFALNDLNLRREPIEVMLLIGKEHSLLSLEATATHDGYFCLLLPLAKSQALLKIGIQFGRRYKWIELESAELIKLSSLFTQNEREHTLDPIADIALDQMNSHDGGLYECQSEDSLLVYAPLVANTEDYALRIIFRPIVLRQPAKTEYTDC